MAKFLDSNGLHVVWARVKELVGNAIKTNVSDKLGKASGIATLGSDGKLTGSQLPALKSVNGQSVVGSGNIEIDLSVFKVVESLPASGDERKVYLIKAPEKAKASKNIYIEYAWVNGDWEKLGEYKAGIDIESYLKAEYSADELGVTLGDENGAQVTILPANGSRAGVMTADEHNELASAFVLGTGGVVSNVDTPKQTDEDVTVGVTRKNLTGKVDDWMIMEETQTLVIPAASEEKAGVMTAADKKLLLEVAQLSSVPDSSEVTFFGDDKHEIVLNGYEILGDNLSEISHTINLPLADDVDCGLMSSFMFNKLADVASNATADAALSTAEIEGILV